MPACEMRLTITFMVHPIAAMALKIVSFEPRYASRFRDLNLAWLDAYFQVEEKDRLLLEQSELYIIRPGGYIFLGLWEGEVVGCFALIKLGDGVYELGKMAVDPAYQGKNIGQDLLQFAIDYARGKQWKKIVLYSNTRLGPALHIYRKYGFKEIVLESELPYVRSDIKMELLLEKGSLNT